MRVRVVIQGVSGRMGQVVLSALTKSPDFRPVGALRRRPEGDTYPLPDGSGLIPLSSDPADLIRQARPDIILDFSVADATMATARIALPLKVHLVTGTTGLTEAHLKELDALARESGVGVVVAPNFALGAVLLVHLGRLLGRFFDYAEILEAHHEAKIDAPSGTALAIARALVQGRGKPFTRPAPEKEPLPGTRGADFQGITIHAQRLPGRLAHHEVVLGALGQTLSLRHDTISRDCYIPGVLLALREVVQLKGLVVGLERLLGL